MATKLQIRRDSLNKWFVVNPKLSEGEIGFVTNTNKIKIGDGVHKWNDLPYIVADTTQIEHISKQIECIEKELLRKANKETVYTKDEANRLFIDMKQLDEKAQYIIEEILHKVYTKDEAQALFSTKAEVNTVKGDLETKISNVYTKSEVDFKLSQKIAKDEIKAGEGIYFTEDSDNNLVINAKATLDVSFVDSEDIEFQKNDDEISATLKYKVYTKSETDELFATKSELEKVSNIIVSTKNELDTIKETIDGVDFSKQFVQLDENVFSNLEDGELLIWNKSLGKWVSGNIDVGCIKVWKD